MTRIESQPAYILHRRPYKEQSYLLDVFTLNFGRMGMVARASGSKRSVSGAHLQVFQPLLLSWTGKSELKTLCESSTPSPALSLAGNRLYCAYYLNELVLYLAPVQVTATALFECYTETLAELTECASMDIPLRVFECRLLSEMGMAPDFRFDVQGLPIEAEKVYWLNRDHGFEVIESALAIDGSRIVSGHALMWLGHASEEESLDSDAPDEETTRAQSHVSASVDVRRQAKGLMRQLIDEALNGRRLKSRELIMQMNEAKV